jgi:hypothetical protein
MESFTVEGKQVTLPTVFGEVTGCGKRSDSYVSGSGGGGNGNYRQPVSISTTVVVTQEFFVRGENGKEQPYKIVALDIPIRDGQHVTMISASVSGHGEWPVRLANHTADRSWPVNEPRMIARELGLAEKNKVTALKVAGIWAAAMFLPFGVGFFFAGVGYAVYRYIHCGRVAKLLTAGFDAAAGKALAAGPPIPLRGRGDSLKIG